MSRMEQIVDRPAGPGRDVFTPQTDRERQMWNAMTIAMDSMKAQFTRFVSIVNTELTFGNPNNGPLITELGQEISDNVEGRWVTVSLTDPAQLGAGGLAPVVFTHGLNVTVQTGAAVGLPLLPNVRWLVVCFSYGLKSANLGNPPPAANPAHSSLHFLAGDPVTANAISLRVHSNLVPAVIAPLIVEVFFQRAVI